MAAPTARVTTEAITSTPDMSKTSELYQYLNAAGAYQPTETSSTFTGITVAEVSS